MDYVEISKYCYNYSKIGYADDEGKVTKTILSI